VTAPTIETLVQTFAITRDQAALCKGYATGMHAGLGAVLQEVAAAGADHQDLASFRKWLDQLGVSKS
jgi:hypothetical protein